MVGILFVLCMATVVGYPQEKTTLLGFKPSLYCQLATILGVWDPNVTLRFLRVSF